MPIDAWSFDEFAHAGPEHLDPAYVSTYDRKAAVDPAEDLAVLRSHGLSAQDTMIDFGAGTGTLALAVAPFCKRIVAVDVSPTMLTSLRTRADRLGITNIEYAHAGFLSYRHTGDPADVVYSRNALHHLPDFWKAIALQRIAAMVRSGGLLRLRDLVFSFEPDQAETAIAAWLAGAANTPAEGWTREELETHLRQEYSTFTWLLEPMLRRAGFQIRQTEYSPSGIYAAYLCVKEAAF